MQFARDTTVSVERSKGEIERILTRYDATEFASGWKSERAMMQFRMNERVIRFVLPLPSKEDFRATPSSRRTRNENATLQAWEQGCRHRWRALLLSIKAKLESAESGIEEFETAFMGQIVMPNGQTMAEIALPQIAIAYKSGKMPALMLEY
jgi:hypothetical protein